MSDEKKPINLIETADAMIWAQEFVRTKFDNGWSLEDIDESLMVGWFASAMQVAVWSQTAALEKRLAEAGWQPIETAPKDGTSVLVFPATWGNKSASIAKWDEDKYARKPRPYWSRDDDLGTMTISRKNPPTHWMPLPPPPQENTHD